MDTNTWHYILIKLGLASLMRNHSKIIYSSRHPKTYSMTFREGANGMCIIFLQRQTRLALTDSHRRQCAERHPALHQTL